MDQFLDIKTIPILDSTLKDSNIRKNIVLLCVFGCNGEEVIFATKEDDVYCFGRNRFCGLGLGTDEDGVKEPQLNTALSGKNVIDISCGYEHWIALTADGLCYSWGHNQFGQLGIESDNMTSTPQLIQSLSYEKVIELSCGATHSLALTTEGLVYSWGSNKSGQLGNGAKGYLDEPQKMPFEDRVMSISCGKNHSIALTVSGQAYVWGLNNYGQLGVELKNGFIAYFPKHVFISNETLFSKVICGPNYSLLLSSDGSVYSFGENSCGQIGNGSTHNQVTPYKVNEDDNDIKYKDIIAHKENDISIVVSTDGTQYVWGLAKNRRILKPKEITDTTFKSMFDTYAKYAKTKLTFRTLVVSDVLNSCQRIDRKLNKFQTIDSNKAIPSPEKGVDKQLSPKNIQTLDDVLDLKSFPILYTTLSNPKVRNRIRLLRVFGIKGSKVIFATNADKVYGFGLNRDGSLGLGTNEIKIRRPLLNEVLSGKQLVDISPGFEHCLGLTANGLIYGWGQNRYGQLGNRKTENEFTPQLVEDLADLKVTQIKCGAYFSMALTSDGELFSWGHNTFAQLGDRTYNSREIPTQVFISEKVVSISCGTNHSMALSESGRVYIWGNNTTGQLGRHPDLDIQKSREKPMSNRPRVLENFENIQKAVCGQNHSLILTTDGCLYTFGGNTNGQIGNGTVKDQFTPFQLNDTKKIRIKEIVSNFDVDFSVVITDNNKCYVWGLVKYQKVLKPKAIPESYQRLFDIYGLYSANKTMFKTLVINTLEQIECFGIQSPEPEEDLIDCEEEFYRLFPQNLFNFSTNELKISKEMIDSNEAKEFDKELDINLFPILSATLKDKNMRKSIRLLYVFGKSGSNVIFATNEDKVYGFGDNSDGSLGLGAFDQNIKSPKLNQTLSYNQLIDIQSGFKHCLGLTASGQCYSWGQNRYGQLGIGENMPSSHPKLIDALKGKRVIQISCGANHSMVLTTEGQVYSWGLNILGQLGSSNYHNYSTPVHIDVKHPIVSISCGLNHSSAVDNIGMSYAWGHNKFGQLGREKERDYRPERKEWIANRPSSNLYFKNISFIKSICGPNYTLFLTNDGFIYAFGDNTNGQVGSGQMGQQFRPVRINEEIRFKDIITHFSNDLTIAVSTEGRHYIWGLADNRKVLSPKLIPKSSKDSVFNIYAKYAAIKVTFKTIIFNETKAMNPSVVDCSYEEDNGNGDLAANRNSVSIEEYDNSFEDDYKLSHSLSGSSEQPTDFDNLSNRSSIQSSNPSTTFQNRLNQCFDNPNNSDLKVISEDKVIYCHKTILQIRSQKFWQILTQNLSEDKKEITINGEKFELFYAFLQYLYGIEPQISDKIVSDLYTMAQHFEEKDLLDECSHYIQRMEMTPNLENVCPLYEKAIKDRLTDLEDKCIEFAANNWKMILNSDGFQSLNDSLSKRLMVSALSRK